MCQDQAIQWLCDNGDVDDVTEQGSCESTTVAAAASDNPHCDATLPEEVCMVPIAGYLKILFLNAISSSTLFL
jgi:hypothetical protein